LGVAVWEALWHWAVLAMGAAVLVTVMDEKRVVGRCGGDGCKVFVGEWGSWTWWVSSWWRRAVEVMMNEWHGGRDQW